MNFEGLLLQLKWLAHDSINDLWKRLFSVVKRGIDDWYCSVQVDVAKRIL